MSSTQSLTAVVTDIRKIECGIIRCPRLRRLMLYSKNGRRETS